MPYIASASLPQELIEAVRTALFVALDDPALAATRATLGLTGARVLGPADYTPVMEFEREAARLGYPELA